jgi:hypothetical protein
MKRSQPSTPTHTSGSPSSATNSSGSSSSSSTTTNNDGNGDTDTKRTAVPASPSTTTSPAVSTSSSSPSSSMDTMERKAKKERIGAILASKLKNQVKSKRSKSDSPTLESKTPPPTDDLPPPPPLVRTASAVGALAGAKAATRANRDRQLVDMATSIPLFQYLSRCPPLHNIPHDVIVVCAAYLGNHQYHYTITCFR